MSPKKSSTKDPSAMGASGGSARHEIPGESRRRLRRLAPLCEGSLTEAAARAHANGAKVAFRRPFEKVSPGYHR